MKKTSCRTGLSIWRRLPPLICAALSVTSPCLAQPVPSAYHPLSVGHDALNIVFSADACKMAVIHFSINGDVDPETIQSSLQVFALDSSGAQGKLLYEVEKPGQSITSAAWTGDTLLYWSEEQEPGGTIGTDPAKARVVISALSHLNCWPPGSTVPGQLAAVRLYPGYSMTKLDETGRYLFVFDPLSFILDHLNLTHGLPPDEVFDHCAIDEYRVSDGKLIRSLVEPLPFATFEPRAAWFPLKITGEGQHILFCEGEQDYWGKVSPPPEFNIASVEMQTGAIKVLASGDEHGGPLDKIEINGLNSQSLGPSYGVIAEVGLPDSEKAIADSYGVFNIDAAPRRIDIRAADLKKLGVPRDGVVVGWFPDAGRFFYETQAALWEVDIPDGYARKVADHLNMSHLVTWLGSDKVVIRTVRTYDDVTDDDETDRSRGWGILTVPDK